MGTQFARIYNRFLGKITDDMYMELTPEDTIKDLRNLLIDAIPGFEFPRKALMGNYVLETLVVEENEVQQEVKQLAAPKLTKTKTDVTRAQAMRNPKTLYIFTDNTNRTSGKTEIDPESWYSQKYRKTVPLRYPSQTSAMLRGLDNARPISTQHWYDRASGKTRDAGRWNDSDFAEFKKEKEIIYSTRI